MGGRVEHGSLGAGAVTMASAICRKLTEFHDEKRTYRSVVSQVLRAVWERMCAMAVHGLVTTC